MGEPFDVVDALRAVSPRFAAGVDRIHEVIDGDGALPAADKALFTAAAAAAQSQPLLLRSSLERARELGTTASAAAGAALVLLISRGEGVSREFALAVREVFDASVFSGSGADAAITATTEEALSYFRDHFGGEVPLRQRLFSEVAPLAFEGYYLMHQAALKHNELDPRTVELLLCAIIASTYHVNLLEIHVASARAVGATEREIVEAVLCAVPVAGVAVWSSGAAAVASTR